MARTASDENEDRLRFDYVRRAERAYAAQLRSLADQVGRISRGFDLDDPDQVAQMGRALIRYSEGIDPWAVAVASRMARDVSKRSAQVWQKNSATISRLLQGEVSRSAHGKWYKEEIARQVGLIKSIPSDAGLRAQNLAIEAVTATGARADEVATQIQATGSVSRSRATLIARTEIARASSTLVQARAQSIGADLYIWRTSDDANVRPSHREMEGKVIDWNVTPTLSDGTVTHAGCIYNCRCWPEPVLPRTPMSQSQRTEAKLL